MATAPSALVLGEIVLKVSGLDRGQVWSVTETDAKLSEYLVDHIDKHRSDVADGDWREVRLTQICPEMKSACVPPGSLGYVVEWLQHHKGVPPPTPALPLQSNDMSKLNFTPWDVAFAARLWAIKQVLYDVLIAAHYLRIKPLVAILCAQIACAIKGLPIDQIKDRLNPNA